MPDTADTTESALEMQNTDDDLSAGRETVNEEEDTGKDSAKKTERKPARIKLSENPSKLLSKDGFALYVGKTPIAITSMAKAGKLPAFYMSDPLNPGGNAELWIHRGEWDKYAEQLVEDAPDEWHSWKERLHHSKASRRHMRPVKEQTKAVRRDGYQR